MELKLESGLPHQEYAVRAVSEAFMQVEMNREVIHYSNPVINLASPQLVTNIINIQKKEQQNVAEKFRTSHPVGNTLCLDIRWNLVQGKHMFIRM